MVTGMTPKAIDYTRAVVKRLGQDVVTAGYWPHVLLV